MLTKESKIRVLENFYGLDYTLLGNRATTFNECCPEVVKEYVTTKGALMSVYIEMLNTIGHSPKPITEKVDSKYLLKEAKNAAKIARENCKILVTSPKGRQDVKQEIRESLKQNKKAKLDEVVQQKIREKAMRLAVDNLLVARAISESTEYKKLNSFEGKIIEEAYKLLRDTLVEIAIILNDD